VNVRRLVSLAFVVAGLLTGLAGAVAAPAESIVVIPIHGTIDDAKAIVLDVDTFGGLVSSATEIHDALVRSGLPVDAYVSERAWSAGALITLSAGRIIMAPGSSIGAAEPIPKTVKTVSALRGEFASTAALYHRDPVLAAGMVDATVDAPPYKHAGQILTLTVDDAIRAHYAEAGAPDLNAALAVFGLGHADRIGATYTLAEQIARFATNPEVSGLLLSLGFIGLLIEMQTLHGVAGIVGASALALFFGTHVYAGFSNMFVLVLAFAGVLGILFELHVLPGHGLAGTLGVIALVGAVLLAFGLEFVFVAVQALSIAIVLSAIAFVIATRIFPENAFMTRLAFAGVQGSDYVAGGDHHALLGKVGYAASLLRPAGVATIEGERVDVLTEGEFVTAGTPVRVVRVEGARVFVHPEN
jgi:membrane-bound serine protease (ClpP class)